MEKEVSKHTNDILMKSMSELYKNQVLQVYHLDYPKIKDVLPNNFPQMKVDEKRADNVFLLEDDSILLLEYETTKRIVENHLKYCEYVLRIVNRYYTKSKQIKTVHVAVIYSSDIKPDFHLLNMGSMLLETRSVSLRNFDGDATLAHIRNKMKNGNSLEKKDIMKLILVPLMRTTTDRQLLIHQCIDVAKSISNDYDQIAVIQGILTATDKMIDEQYSKKVREWLRMTKVEKIYQQEKEEELKDRVSDIAKKMLTDLGLEPEKVSELTGLTIEEVQKMNK